MLFANLLGDPPALPVTGVYTLAPGAGGAAGAIAWGGAPQRGAQPQEYEVHDLISPGGGVRS
jgi:hypothetical protein